jgi:hypothetical protein
LLELGDAGEALLAGALPFVGCDVAQPPAAAAMQARAIKSFRFIVASSLFGRAIGRLPAVVTCDVASPGGQTGICRRDL